MCALAKLVSGSKYTCVRRWRETQVRKTQRAINLHTIEYYVRHRGWRVRIDRTSNTQPASVEISVEAKDDQLCLVIFSYLIQSKNTIAHLCMSHTYNRCKILLLLAIITDTRTYKYWSIVIIAETIKILTNLEEKLCFTEGSMLKH